jgi:hypothetical protein
MLEFWCLSKEQQHFIIYMIIMMFCDSLKNTQSCQNFGEHANTHTYIHTENTKCEQTYFSKELLQSGMN